METTDSSCKTVLAGQKTVLRPIVAADLPTIQAWDADPAIIALMGRRFDAQQPEEWLRSVRSARTCRAWLVVSPEGQPLGEVELAQINWRAGTAEVRICIGAKECWGQGIGTDALIISLTYAFETMNLQAIYLRVFATNLRAIRLYERMGFRKRGLLPPSERRGDPAPVLLMNLTEHRWAARRLVTA